MSRNARPSKNSKQTLIAEVGAAARRLQNAQDRFDEAAFEHLGVNRSDGRALDVIDQHGSITAGELAREAGLSTGAITTLLDRLERAGYVRRVRDETDRRRVLVEPTELARRRTGEIWGPIGRQSAAELTRYTAAELAVVHDFLSRGRELLAAHTERVGDLAEATNEADAPGMASRRARGT